ncbi:MAG: response regulator [Nitrosopumilus sp.]|nr:response regulator [Nitrosopumilus sp.]
MRILIIDDNPIVVNVFTKLLRTKGFFVTAESTFKAGLQHLENELYHVVFVDAPLDNYTEKQILTSLKENHVFQKTTVFLFSSVDFNNIELDEWKKEGLYSYLKKPVKRSTIIKALDDIRVKINFTSPQIPAESIVGDEPPTLEQLEKVNQLQKQIKELENISHQPTLSQKDLQQKKSINIVPESIVDVPHFKNIMDDARSLQSDFKSTELFIKKPYIETNIEQNKIMKKELEQTLSEISKLKNEIQLLDEIDDQKLQHDQVSSINDKKHKLTKKPKSTRTKKHKLTKK